MASCKYEFPTLSPSCLQTFFQDSFPELTINESDFKQPSRERWRFIFTTLVSDILNISENVLLHAQPTIETDIVSPELHTESINMCNLGLALNFVLHAMLYDLFSMKDIINPEPKKLVKICSAFHNFFQFKATRMPCFDRIKDNVILGEEQMNDLMVNNENLKEKINSRRAANAQRQEDVKEVELSQRVLREQIESLAESVKVKQEAITERKSAQHAKKVHNAQIKEKILVAKQEGARLDTLIVQSPERKKNDMVHLTRQLTAQQQETESCGRRLVELQDSLQRQQLTDACCATALRIITDISNNTKKENEASRAIRDLQEKAQMKQQAIGRENLREQQAIQQMNLKLEQLDKMLRQNHMKAAAIQSTVGQLKPEMEMMASSQREYGEEQRRLSEEVTEEEEQEAEEGNKHEAAMSQLREHYNQLLQQVDTYHTRLGQSWLSLRDSLDRTSPSY